MNYDKKLIGERIEKSYKALGFTQGMFATILGVTRQQVGRWKNGEAIPSMEQLLLMCRDHVTITREPIEEPEEVEYGDPPRIDAYNTDQQARKRFQELGMLNGNTFNVDLFACEVGYILGEHELPTREQTDIYAQTGLTPDTIKEIQDVGFSEEYNLLLLNMTKVIQRLHAYRQDYNEKTAILSEVPKPLLKQLFAAYQSEFTLASADNIEPTTSDVYQFKQIRLAYIYNECRKKGLSIQEIFKNIQTEIHTNISDLNDREAFKRLSTPMYYNLAFPMTETSSAPAIDNIIDKLDSAPSIDFDTEINRMTIDLIESGLTGYFDTNEHDSLHKCMSLHEGAVAWAILFFINRGVYEYELQQLFIDTLHTICPSPY